MLVCGMGRRRRGRWGRRGYCVCGWGGWGEGGGGVGGWKVCRIGRKDGGAHSVSGTWSEERESSGTVH